MFNRSGILALGAVVFLWSCAAGGNDENGTDPNSSDVGAAPINTYVDSGVTSQDTGLLMPPGQDNGTTTPTEPVDPINPGTCDYNGMNIAQQSAETNDQYQVLLYTGATSANPPTDSISIEIYQSAEFGGPTTPGTYSVDGANYSDCGLCVRIFKNIPQGGAAPEKEFFADKGTVTITSIGDDGRITGTFDNLEFKEVTIDSNTWVSTAVPGGETWCMSNVAFDSEITSGGGTTTPGEMPTADPSVTQASCVPDGNGHWINNNVGDFTLTNCNGDQVNLHSLGCDPSTKALYIVSTAGWCPACKQLIGSLKNQWSPGSTMTQADVEAAVPGLKLLIVLAENHNYAQPTQQYCKQYAAGDGVDPAMIVMDFNPTGLTIPLAAPQGAAFTTESMATTWSKINPYLVADSQGQIMSGFPWEAVIRGSNMSYVYSSFYDQTKYADYYINLLLNE